MAIGDIRAAGGPEQAYVQDRSSQTLANIGQGVGAAINDLAGAVFQNKESKLELEKYYDSRQMASKNLSAETAFVEQQRKNAELFTTLARDRSTSPLGLTNDYDAAVEASNTEFLKGLDPRLQEEYKNKLQVDKTNRRLAAFQTELTLLDESDKTQLTANLNVLGTAIKSGDASLEDANEQWGEFVTKSGLPEDQKAALLLSGQQTLATLQFSNDVGMAAKGYGQRPGAVADGSDVVAGGLSPQQRGILNGIASEEASGYDVMNGGERFTDFSDHPRRIGANGTSTAAGRYQYIASTWDAAKAGYEKAYGIKVPDFSPEWQDRVTVYWVERRFNEISGGSPSYAEIIASGNREQLLHIKNVLGNPRGGNERAVEWQGLGPMSDEKFLEIFSGERGLAGGGTPGSTGPDVWSDPRFAGIGLDQKIELSNNASEAAAKAQRDAAAAATRAASDLKDQAFALGYGSGNLNDLEQLRTTPGFSAEVEQRFREGVDGNRKKETSINEVTEKMAAGTRLTAKDQDGLTNWYGEDSFRDLQSGDKGAIDKLKYAAKQSGMLPNGTVDALHIAMDSPTGKQPALELLAQLHESSPDILTRSGFSDKDVADALVYSRFAERGSAADALTKYNQLQENNAQPGMREKNETAARKYFTENITPSSITALSDTVLTSEASAPINPAVQSVMMNDAYSAFVDGYALYGTQDAALQYMNETVSRIWNPTSVGTAKQLMRYAPDSGKFGFPQVEGGYGWMNEALDEHTAMAGNMRSATFTPGTSTLVADSQTEQEVRAGKLPTYTVTASTSTGEIVVLPGRFGGEALSKAGETAINEQADKKVVRVEYSQAVKSKDTVDHMLAMANDKAGTLTADEQAQVNELAAESARLGEIVLDKKKSLDELSKISGERGVQAVTRGVIAYGLSAAVESFVGPADPPAPPIEELVRAAISPTKPKVDKNGYATEVTEAEQYTAVVDASAGWLAGRNVVNSMNSRSREILKNERKSDGSKYTMRQADKRSRAEHIANKYNLPLDKVIAAVGQ